VLKKVRVERDSEGFHLIDRNGKLFGYILDYLRDGTVTLPPDLFTTQQLLKEAEFYAIQGLVDLCRESIDLLIPNPNHTEPMCQVPMITSLAEEQTLIGQSNKPVVKLLYNRGNNKYSYTSHSDDNMLKNIELFDKLALRFNNRILFLKDIIGEDICVWTFFGHGRKVAEICCTSIVYATEKKQTKVEFPEARIYEEALNILLYEGPKSFLIPGADMEKDMSSGELVPRVRRIHAGGHSHQPSNSNIQGSSR